MPWPEPRPPNYSTEDDCAICYERLVIPNTSGETGPSTIIDDVKVRCGHHFHWSCFEDYDRADDGYRAICPICRQSTLNAEGLLIVDVVNEGGFSGAVNLGEILDQDRWEEKQPEEWKRGQALLSFCQFGELEDAERLLKDEGADPNAAYPDGMTGLHMAALNNAVEWASLLLRYGANKDLKNDQGQTALDYAKSADAGAIVELLRG
ncbi:hypothetical protein H0H87_012386 [Tephrocybe sp. NHM501043]|nr:hypothetical protein H0H87_012386 [Tephrocybe sp. NHM501043]